MSLCRPAFASNRQVALCEVVVRGMEAYVKLYTMELPVGSVTVIRGVLESPYPYSHRSK